jgi:hypothetical protein
LFSRLGYDRAARLILPFEDLGKQLVFDCQTCGQCILHSAGMTCSMSCPKNIRNGPCGGVRLDGHCEVEPETMCVWVDAYERSLHVPTYGSEITVEQPPVNWQLKGTSAWTNMLTGADCPTTEGQNRHLPRAVRMNQTRLDRKHLTRYKAGP